MCDDLDFEFEFERVVKFKIKLKFKLEFELHFEWPSLLDNTVDDIQEARDDDGGADGRDLPEY